MDFSLTTLFVAPVGQTALPSAGSTQDLTVGQVGVFRNDYSLATAGNIAAAPYFYVAQGRENSILQGSKRSDKIAASNILEWYKVAGCAIPATQVTDVGNWTVKCGDVVSLTLRAHSAYIDTLYFNGLTRSVTVQAPCCDCDSDPCVNVDVPALIDSLILKLEQAAPGTNPDNISLKTFFQFQRIGDDATAVLRISAKPLTTYGNPCDVSAFPHEYDRMWFRAFVYEGPDTTADFIVSDACNHIATPTVTQRATYATGTGSEIQQLEKDYYSYQAGFLKHLYRMVGYNQNFESFADANEVYDTYYIKFNNLENKGRNWGDYVQLDSTVIIAAVSGSDIAVELEAVLEASLGAIDAINSCVITTSTTTTVWPTTTTTSTLTP